MFIFKYLIVATITFVSTLSAQHKAVLFNDTSAWYHWGCTGTSTALKEGIQYLGFELQSFPINLTYTLKEVPQFSDFDNQEKFNLFCKENPDVVQAIQNTDAVLITGEGTIHDLRPGPMTLLYVAHISKKFFGKHVEIINHSAYPKDDIYKKSLENLEVTNVDMQELKKAQEVYQEVYSELDFIAIREPYSQNEMNDINICSTLSFDCLPLYIQKHYQKQKKIEEKTIIIAGSVAFTDSGTVQLCRYIEAMAKRGYHINVLIGAAAFPAKDDQKFINFLKDNCQAKFEIINASSLEEWLDTINNGLLLVSGRFHHSIAAFCLNTPFIALNSNTPKVHSICSLLSQKAPFHYSDPQLLNHLLQRTEEILANPSVNNEDTIIKLRALAEKNFDGLRAFNSTN